MSIVCLWVATFAMIGGMVVEFAGFIGMKHHSLGRGLRCQALGAILFYAGVVVLIAASLLT